MFPTQLRQTARSLARRPAFSALAVAMLAVGVGASTAVYSVADATLFRPLPFDESHRVVRLHSFNAARGFDFSNVSYPNFREWRDETDLFEAASAFRVISVDLAGTEAPQRVRVGTVGTDFFAVLRARTVAGRTFEPDDHDPAGELVAVLSEPLWRSRFGGDPNVVGRSVRLDGVPHTVVGVVDESGQWPLDARVWVPVRFVTEPTRWNNHSWQVIARLAPGTSITEAGTGISTLARRASAAQPEERDQGWDAAATPLLSLATGDEMSLAFYLLFAAVAAVLLLASLNVANLLLTQGLERARLFAIRSALGAGRRRLVGLVLGESVLLALVGGALGVAVALGSRELIAGLAPVELPRMDQVGLRLPVLAVGLGVSLAASLCAGLLPAWYLARRDVGTVLRSGGSDGIPARRVRSSLVATQLAVSLILLVTSGVLVRTLQQTLEVEPGFRSDGVLAFTLSLPATRYDSGVAVNLFYDELLARIGTLPGVEAASATSVVPFGGGGINLFRVFLPEGALEPPAGPDHGAQWFEVDPGWFDTLGVGALEGRTFTASDSAGAPPVMMVNQAMADQLGAGASPLGMRVRSWRDENLLRTVVGVLPNLAYTGLTRSDRPAVYVPRAQSTRRQMGVLVRAEGPVSLLPAVQTHLAALDANVAVDGVVTLEQQAQAQLAGPRFISTLLSLFGLVSLALAATGIYGLTAFAVVRRTREIGIRLALGATRGMVRGLVLRQAAPVLTIGCVVGLGAATVVARVAVSQVPGLAVIDRLQATGSSDDLRTKLPGSPASTGGTAGFRLQATTGLGRGRRSWRARWRSCPRDRRTRRSRRCRGRDA